VSRQKYLEATDLILHIPIRGAPAMMHWRLKADKAALRKRETNNKSRKAIYNEPSLSIRLDHGDVMIMVVSRSI
jgi:hypothetical protein